MYSATQENNDKSDEIFYFLNDCDISKITEEDKNFCDKIITK